jgi:phage terminase large subunit-like protein
MLYLNNPLAKEFMAFNPDWFSYYEESECPEEGDSLVTLDPADPPTGRKSQDYSAIVSVKHTKRGLFVRRYRRKRLTDKQMIAETFEVADEDGATKIRIEVNRYAHLAAAFREQMKINNKYYAIDEVKAKKINKEARIKNRLSPLFENKVIFTRRGMRELEEELTTFPYGKHDDLIDALSWQVGERTSTEYEKKEQGRPALPSGRRVFTLEEIRQSCRGRYQAPYPFARQMELVPS